MSFEAITNAAMDQIFSSLGETAILMADPQRPIRGVFSETSEEVEPHGVVVSTTNPNLLVSLADFGEKPAQGDKLQVRSRIYIIKEVHLDGYGNALLELYSQ